MALHDAIPRKLLDPSVYPWSVDRVEMIETHLSWVFLAGERVLKVRRPVQFPFVDQRSLEQRHRFCLDDVRLNRRLSTDVYLQVEPITVHDGQLAIGGAGVTIEWCSLMRRLPDVALLTRQIEDDDLDAATIDGLGDHLAAFHQTCPPCRPANPDAYPTGDLEIILANLEELRQFADRWIPSASLRLVTDAMTRFIRIQADLFCDRVEKGWIRDGHGDLRAEHVFLEGDGQIQVIDCVEFSPAIRCADVASDLAFLLMDLRRLGRDDAADRIVARYQNRGIPLPPDLLRFYQAHRALVRAKINALTIENGRSLDHHVLADQIGDYTNLALQMVTVFRPVLVVMTGLSGTGKSTVAGAVAEMFAAVPVRSDVIRKMLTGLASSGSEPWQAGIYGPEWTERTYGVLFEEAEEMLASGKPVVLDASFLDQQWRDEVAALGRRLAVPVVLLETVSDPDIVEQRLQRRNEIGGDPVRRRCRGFPAATRGAQSQSSHHSGRNTACHDRH